MSTGTIALPQPRAGALARLLKPSFADVLFVMVIVWSFMAGGVGWYALFADADAGFHIRVGDWILQHREVPVTHPFAFSVTGKEWYAFEWLTEALLGAVHGAWGLKGVSLLAGVTIAAAFTLLFRYAVWRGAHPVIALVLVLAAMNTNRIHSYARPHIFTWVFLTAAIWMIERDRRSPSRAVWLLAPFTALWANMHGGFVVFFPLLALLIAGLAIEGWIRPDQRAESWGSAKRYALVGSASAAASLLNPYGYHLHSHIAEVLRAKWLLTLVQEFRSPMFNSESMTAFMILLFLGLGSITRLWSRGRIGDAFWILFLAYSSLISVRHVTIFALVATPVIAVELSLLWETAARGATRGSVLGIIDDIGAQFASGAARTSLWPAVFVLWLCVAPNQHWPADFPSERFPIRLIERNSAALSTSRVFATDQWSNYLIYKNYPRQRVFIDGQNQYYGESHLKDYMAIAEGKPGWSTALDKFRLDHVLCPKNSPLASLMQTRSDWKQIDEGDGGVLFAPVRGT